jgi:hypothetical protein
MAYGPERIELDVTQKLYASLKQQADYYNIPVEEFIEDKLEELYG